MIPNASTQLIHWVLPWLQTTKVTRRTQIVGNSMGVLHRAVPNHKFSQIFLKEWTIAMNYRPEYSPHGMNFRSKFRVALMPSRNMLPNFHRKANKWKFAYMLDGTCSVTWYPTQVLWLVVFHGCTLCCHQQLTRKQDMLMVVPFSHHGFWNAVLMGENN